MGCVGMQRRDRSHLHHHHQTVGLHKKTQWDQSCMALICFRTRKRKKKRSTSTIVSTRGPVFHVYAKNPMMNKSLGQATHTMSKFGVGVHSIRQSVSQPTCHSSINTPPTEAVAGDGLVRPLSRAARARDEDVQGKVGGEGAGDEEEGAEEEPTLGHGVGKGEGAAPCCVVGGCGL